MDGEGGSMSTESTLDEGILLEYIRKEANCPDIEYLQPPQPIPGGYATKIYHVQLLKTPETLPGNLVLRLLPPNFSESSVIHDKIVHNYLASKGYPTPRVHLTCMEKSLLGGAFCLMDFVEGDTMLKQISDSTPRQLAEIHANLHKINPEPLLKELETKGFALGTDSWFSSQKSFIEKKGREWMREPLQWLIDNYPKDTLKALCHSDLHLINILVKDNRVTGVLDWGLRYEDPAYDVATAAITGWTLGSMVIPGLDWNGFVQRFIDEYRALIPLDADVFEYFKAMKIFTIWVTVEYDIDVWLYPGVQESISEQFKKITGIEPENPYIKKNAQDE